MIEELQMIKDIVGDLSAVGGWVAGGVILYKFISTMVFYIGGGLLIKFIMEALIKYHSADMSKEEVAIILRGAQKAESENVKLQGLIDGNRSRHEGEMAEIKSLYKVLKEASNNDKST